VFQQFINGLKRDKGQKGFTLMELMVVIVIVAILAAVAVPLYVNYVRDAQRTEAKGAIGAIVTAQQAYYQKTAGSGTATYASLQTLKDQGLLDIREAEIKWLFEDEGAASTTGYGVKATLRGSNPAVSVTYLYTRDGGGNFDN